VDEAARARNVVVELLRSCAELAGTSLESVKNGRGRQVRSEPTTSRLSPFDSLDSACSCSRDDGKDTGNGLHRCTGPPSAFLLSSPPPSDYSSRLLTALPRLVTTYGPRCSQQRRLGFVANFFICLPRSPSCSPPHIFDSAQPIPVFLPENPLRLPASSLSHDSRTMYINTRPLVAIFG
jgi:hypothetical protein